MYARGKKVVSQKLWAYYQSPSPFFKGWVIEYNFEHQGMIKLSRIASQLTDALDGLALVTEKA
jgi:hypothetical protein